ncbi:hypothetical protein GPECTOR_4g768 [Gonium pectorale]|uniref:Uncharacterized protein n=1 Tax=Gonium pectorale TaxID=33097 RepID=A0A150GZD3_GONPE|nr:hypothetical protein GPECTOR_4g768 [Gonium pectorale]|eukprot:KXZ54700.1 hypothetical protein GPECTOR_4g768 [Gonium pectorale]
MSRRAGHATDGNLCGDLASSNSCNPLQDLHRRRLAALLCGLAPEVPPHAFPPPGGGLRQQAAQRSQQRLARARRAAETYRPHLRAAATAAITAAAARAADAAKAAAAAAAAAAAEAASRQPEVVYWRDLLSAMSAWEAASVAEERDEVLAAVLAARQRGAPGRAAAKAGAGMLSVGLVNAMTGAVNAMRRVGARGVVERLTAAAAAKAEAEATEVRAAEAEAPPEDGGAEGASGGGDGGPRSGDGGAVAGAGARGRGEAAVAVPAVGQAAAAAAAAAAERLPASILQGMHLEPSCYASFPSSSPSPDGPPGPSHPDVAGLPGRAVFLVRCLVEAWAAAGGATPVPEAAAEVLLDDAVAVTEGLVRYHGGPPLAHNELTMLAFLLVFLQRSQVLTATRAPDDPFAGPRCPLSPAAGAVSSPQLLFRLAARAATVQPPPPPPLPPGLAVREIGPRGLAAAAATATAAPPPTGPLPQRMQFQIAQYLAVALMSAAKRVGPADPWVEVAAAIREAARDLTRTMGVKAAKRVVQLTAVGGAATMAVVGLVLRLTLLHAEVWDGLEPIVKHHAAAVAAADGGAGVDAVGGAGADGTGGNGGAGGGGGSGGSVSVGVGGSGGGSSAGASGGGGAARVCAGRELLESVECLRPVFLQPELPVEGVREDGDGDSDGDSDGDGDAVGAGADGDAGGGGAEAAGDVPGLGAAAPPRLALVPGPHELLGFCGQPTAAVELNSVVPVTADTMRSPGQFKMLAEGLVLTLMSQGYATLIPDEDPRVGGTDPWDRRAPEVMLALVAKARTLLRSGGADFDVVVLPVRMGNAPIDGRDDGQPQPAVPDGGSGAGARRRGRLAEEEEEEEEAAAASRPMQLAGLDHAAVNSALATIWGAIMDGQRRNREEIRMPYDWRLRFRSSVGKVVGGWLGLLGLDGIPTRPVRPATGRRAGGGAAAAGGGGGSESGSDVDSDDELDGPYNPHHELNPNAYGSHMAMLVFRTDPRDATRVRRIVRREAPIGTSSNDLD